MAEQPNAVPGFTADVPETTLGISHGREEAGSCGELLDVASLPLTRVDQTRIEPVTTDAPGMRT